jgi:Protein of unknown function (DUF4089)
MTRGSLSPVNLETFATQTARLLEINLSRGGAALVASQLEILFEHAKQFSEFELPPECEPLTEYVP